MQTIAKLTPTYHLRHLALEFGKGNGFNDNPPIMANTILHRLATLLAFCVSVNCVMIKPNVRLYF
jgi:hypothetical protein